MDDTLSQYTDALERTLQPLTEHHEKLLELLKRKRQAVRSADEDQLVQLCNLENEKLRAIADLEKQRTEIVGQLTLHIQPGATAPLHMADLAEQLPEPARGRLLVMRQRLRERMEQVQRESSTARRATESLARHMQGLVQTIGMIATGVSTYTDNGARPEQATAMSTINMTA